MPQPKKVKIHVSSNNNANGVLSVKVTPWRVHLDQNDVVEWELDGSAGNPKNDILWFRVEEIDRFNKWPFKAPTPPDARYTANAGGKATSTVRDNAANNVDDVIAYGLTIAFEVEDKGVKTIRTMYIDPDMVIDT